MSERDVWREALITRTAPESGDPLNITGTSIEIGEGAGVAAATFERQQHVHQRLMQFVERWRTRDPHPDRL